MTKLKWDQAGERYYETGVDRGVLYLTDGTGIPWNGITGIEEDFSGDTSTPYYLDGVKYLDDQKIGDYNGTLRAYTYPHEFEAYEGNVQILDGFMADGQPNNIFSLCYRTLIGNDTEGTDLAYKIHIVYNLVASQDTTSFVSLNDQLESVEFNWKITAVPEILSDYRPTAHVIIDSRYINSYLLRTLESWLYGDDVTDPYLPVLSDLVDFVTEWDLIEISDNNDGTWSATGPRELLYMLDDTTFQIDSVNATWITPDMYQITTTVDEDEAPAATALSLNKSPTTMEAS